MATAEVGTGPDAHRERGYPGLALWITALLTLAILAAAATAAGAAPAAGPRFGDVTEGTLLWRAARGEPLASAPLLTTDVEVRVTGPVARARIRQEFRNPSASWVEGVYVFPVPEDAAVDRLLVRAGDRTIEGVIKERAAAKAAYESARQAGARASLVEQERPNVFTASVANVAPGAAIAVEIEYQQVLRLDEGRYRLRIPTVVGPRYVPGAPVAAGADAGTGWSPDTDRVPDASRITPPVRRPSAGRINPLTVRVELAAGAPLARLDAPYHAVRVEPGADGRQRVALAGGPVPADRDFELVWEPAPGEAPAAAVFTERRGEETFALLLVLPPSAAAAGARSPREVILVIDTSGSMHGASIGQARAASALALSRLTPADSVNVIEFNSHTRALWPAARPATADNLAAADRFVSGLRAQGGTEMLPALTRALEGAAPEGRLRQVIFLTDGAVGNEAALFAAIRERLGASRLFTVGIGSAPNSYFMRQAAAEGRGTFTYVGSPTEVGAKMSALFRKLEQPALTDLRLELSGEPAAGARPAALIDARPDPIPDVYAGEPVVIAIALRAGELPARAVLRGRRGSAEWQQELAPGPALEHAGLATHWARQKIGALLEQRRASAPEDERAAVRDAVLALALRHGLVSPYTSLVAVDVTPVRPADAALHTAAMETNLPEGWDYDAVFGMGQGATAAPAHLVAGLAALLLAAATLGLARWRAIAAVARAAPAPGASPRGAGAARR